MSKGRGGTEINLVHSLIAGYAVWIIPCVMHGLVVDISARTLVYAAVSTLVVYSVALAVLGWVYRLASARGLPLKVAGAVSLVAAVPVIAAWYLVDYWITRKDPSLAWTNAVAPTTVSGTLVVAIGDSLAICLLLASIVFLPAVARAHEERRRELELLHGEAELLRIRSHLEPHFVLNSLNAVAGLVEEDPVQARELLAALGDLFREATRFRATHRVRDEIEWLKRYVTIHELRHPDILRVSWEIDEDCLEMGCPALILQPLVENALKHGALRGGGHLAIEAKRDAGVLLFVVEDDGPGLGPPREGGQGLAITRRRLQLDAAPSDAFQLVREASRTVARLRLPSRSVESP